METQIKIVSMVFWWHFSCRIKRAKCVFQLIRWKNGPAFAQKMYSAKTKYFLWVSTDQQQSNGAIHWWNLWKLNSKQHKTQLDGNSICVDESITLLLLIKKFHVSVFYLILLSIFFLKNVNNVCSCSCMASIIWFDIHGDFLATNDSSREYESFVTMSRIWKTYHQNRFACVTHS